MWFKNAVIYKFTHSIAKTTEITQTLAEKLASKTFTPCKSRDLSTYGWVPPTGDKTHTLTYSAASFFMFAAHKEEKIIPSDVIKEKVQEKISLIKQKQNRLVFSKEKQQIMEDIIHTLIPQAFTRSYTILAYIDLKNNYLIIDTSSFKKAEELTSYLRLCLGSLPITNITFLTPPRDLMTSWLAEKRSLPQGFTMGYECKLSDPNNKSSYIKMNQQNLLTEEISSHIASDKTVAQLALNWQDQITFVLGDDLMIRKLKFTDILKKQVDSETDNSIAEQFAAEFSIMTLTLEKMLNQLFLKKIV